MELSYLPIARFPLPETLEPEGTQCIQVTLPDGPEYLAILLEWLHALTWSKLYARDATKTGAATVARMWDKTLNEHPVIHCVEGEMSFDIRVKKGAPWISEVSTDGGVTWHDGLEQAHWFAPSSGTPIPPIGSGNADIDAGQIMQRWYMWLTQYMKHRLDSSISKPTIVAEILSMLGLEPGDNAALDTALGNAVDAVDALDPGVADGLGVNECDWMDAYHHWVDEIKGDPQNWLDRLDEILSGVLNAAAADLVEGLNDAASALGGDKWWNWVENNSGGAPGNGAGFGGAGDCDWLVYFAGDVTDTITAPTGFTVALCHTIAFDIPDGYILRGLYLEYNATALQMPGLALILHENPDCGTDDPNIPLWTQTSYALDPAHHVALVTYDGDDETPFTLNDLDISDKMTPNFVRDTFVMPEALRTGPNTYVAAFQWRAAYMLSETGTVGVTVIAQKV